MKKLSLFLWVVIFVLINHSFCYSHEVDTHKRITDQALYYLNDIEPNNYPVYVVEGDLMPKLKIGARKEDNLWSESGTLFPRFVLHFYPRLESNIATGGCSSLQWAFGNNPCKIEVISVPEWMPGSSNSLYSITRSNRYNWTEAIRTENYKKDTGWKALGYVIHLLEDLAVPAHVRNDAHPPWDKDPVDYYNRNKLADRPNQVGNKTKQAFEKFLVEEAGLTKGQKLIYFSTPEECFYSLQHYTRNRFFSKDTCFQLQGELSRIASDDDDYFYDKSGNKIAYKGVRYQKAIEKYGTSTDKVKKKAVIDKVIGEEQFVEKLGPMAVLYVASFIKYYDSLALKITGQVELSTEEGTPIKVSLDDITVTDSDSTYPDDFILLALIGQNYMPTYENPETTPPTFVTITPMAGFSGELTIPIFVHDGVHQSPIFNLRIFVHASDEPASEECPTITCAINPQTKILGQSFTRKLIAKVGEPLKITLDDLKIGGYNPSCSTFWIKALEGENYHLVTGDTRYGSNYVVAEKQPNPDYAGWSWQEKYKEIYDDIKVKIVVNDGECQFPHFPYPESDFSVILPDDGRNSEPFEMTIDVNNRPIVVGYLSMKRGTTRTLTIDDIHVKDGDNNFPEDFTLTVLDGRFYTRFYYLGEYKIIGMTPDDGSTDLMQNYTLNGNKIIPDEYFTGNLWVPIVVNDGIEDSERTLLKIVVEY